MTDRRDPQDSRLGGTRNGYMIVVHGLHDQAIALKDEPIGIAVARFRRLHTGDKSGCLFVRHFYIPLLFVQSAGNQQDHSGAAAATLKPQRE